MSRFDYPIEAAIRISIVKGGFVLIYPQIINDVSNKGNGISTQREMVVETREVFTSIPKMKKKITEVIEIFVPIIDEQ